MKSLLEEIILEQDLLTEDVDVQSITDSIMSMRPAYIKYNSGGTGKATGRRLIYPVAYGVSTAGNPVVRAFEDNGDTLTSVPAWKFFRVDRILWWRTIKDPKHSFKDKELVGLNKSGDEGMTQIFTLSPLCGSLNKDNEPEINAEPITKGDVKGEKQVEELPKNNERKWGFKQIGQDIKKFFTNWKNKYQKNGEVSLDNKGVITYNNGETTKTEKLKAPDTEPVTKDEIQTQEQNATSDVLKNNETDAVRGDAEPVMKADIESTPPDKQNEEETESEITKAFNEMNERWSNLYK